MDTWHFVDMDVRLKPQANSTIVPIKVDDVTIPFCTDCANAVINDLNKTVTSWTKEEINNLDTQIEKSFALRFLIHVIGDVHQPLHSASLVDNDQFRHGDKGGNSFKIKYPAKISINNLHKFFDSGADALAIYERPLNKNDASDMKDFATKLIDEQSKKSPASAALVPHEDWMIESFKVARDFVYREIKPNDVVSDDYRKKSVDILRQRIYLGGVRLASVIEGMYEAYTQQAKSPNKKLRNFLKKK